MGTGKESSKRKGWGRNQKRVKSKVGIRVGGVTILPF